MSYSFSLRASDPQAASAAVADELASVVERQPVHEADRQVAQDAADAVLGLVQVGEGQNVTVAVSGHVGAVDGDVTTVGLNINVAIVPALAE